MADGKVDEGMKKGEGGVERGERSGGGVKEEEIRGSWHPNAFQLFAGTRPGTFEGLGFLCCPTLGVYSEEFHVCLPHATISVPYSPSLVPDEVGKVLKEGGDGVEVDCFVQIHPRAPKMPSAKFISPYDDEVSVIAHPWVFPDTKFLSHPEQVTEVCIGLFQADGVQEVWMDLKDGGVPIGKVESRTVVTHDGAFSPANCMFRPAEPSTTIASFYSVVLLGSKPLEGDHDPVAVARAMEAGASGKRAVVTLHILPYKEELDDQVSSAISKDLRTPLDLLQALTPILKDTPALSKLQTTLHPLLHPSK